MRIRLPREAINNLPRKAVALFLLVGVLLEIGGVPVVRVVRKDRSRPYPCQDHPCGCASADECWHHCCCLNNKQKLVWASEHGVTPPDFVIAAADQEVEEPTLICDRSGCSACSADHPCSAGQPCSTDHRGEERACCRHRKHPPSVATDDQVRHDVVADDDSHHDGANGETETSVKVVLNDFARRCSGLPPVVMLFGDALPCVRPVAWKPVEGRVEYVVESTRPCVSADLSPPVPPPKLRRGVAA
ncbi:MAG TPA: hypothetical protein VFG04_24020 [Planctomycetaceae bacterium]|nr:hypothetical protein [Planctomycetaceae bacterium]